MFGVTLFLDSFCSTCAHGAGWVLTHSCWHICLHVPCVSGAMHLLGKHDLGQYFGTGLMVRGSDPTGLKAGHTGSAEQLLPFPSLGCLGRNPAWFWFHGTNFDAQTLKSILGVWVMLLLKGMSYPNVLHKNILCLNYKFRSGCGSTSASLEARMDWRLGTYQELFVVHMNRCRDILVPFIFHPLSIQMAWYIYILFCFQGHTVLYIESGL